MESTMKRLLLLLALLLAPATASAQCTGVFPAGDVCGSATGGTPHAVPFTSFISSLNLTQYHFLIGNASNKAADTVLSGDCTYGALGIVCTKTSGVNFGYFATGTVYSNLTGATSNLPLIGGGGGNVAQGTRSGNTTSFATTSGSLTSGDCAKFDASGNIIDAGPCGGSSTYTNNIVINVMSGANSCAAATGNGVTDDSTAIQCQIDYTYATWGGGTLFFPPGNFRIGTTLQVKGATALVGLGQPVSRMNAIGDVTVVKMTTTGGGPKQILNMGIFGFTNAAATTPAVLVDTNVGVILRDCTIWGGNFALATAGVDGLVENCDINGWGTTGGGVFSTGANWYVRDKIDNGAAGATTYGFFQGTFAIGGSVAENHFVQSDFSGNYTYSVFIDDTGSPTNTALTVFEGSVFSAPIQIANAKVTIFTTAEFGNAAITSASPLIISTSYGIVAVTASGAGTRTCGVNQNITC